MARSINDLICFFILLTMASCGGKSTGRSPTQLVDETELPAIAEMLASRHDMDTVHAEQSHYKNSSQLHLHFTSKKRMKLEQARELVVASIKDILNSVPDLTPEQLDFSIAFRKKDGEHVAPPYVAYAYLFEGNIYYSTYEAERIRLKKLHKESLKELIKS